MRRSFKAIFNSIFILLGSLSISLGAQNLSSDTEHLLQEKTYISTDQVVISQDGLFLKTEEGISLITQLNYDENGFFILSNTSFIRPQITLNPDGSFEWKSYIRPEQVEIISNLLIEKAEGVEKFNYALTIAGSNGISIVPQLNWDENGLYVSSNFYADVCPNNHRVWDVNRGCREKDCPFNRRRPIH